MKKTTREHMKSIVEVDYCFREKKDTQIHALYK